MQKFKALALCFIALAVVLPGFPVHGQEIIPFAGGGIALGTGDLSTDTDQGWFALGGIDIPLPTLLAREASLRAGISHARIPFDNEFGDEMAVTSVSGELSYHFGRPNRLVQPYLRGGASLNVHEYDPGDLGGAKTTDARAGVVAGAGMNIMFGPTDLVLGAHFTSGTDAGYVGFHGGLALPLR
jgi:hypothetical protein